MYRSAMLAGALALASFPALAQQAPAVVIQVNPPPQQAQGAPQDQPQAPLQQGQSAKPPAQAIGVQGVAPNPRQVGGRQ